MPKSFIVDDEYHETRLDKWFKQKVINLPHSLLEKIIRKNKKYTLIVTFSPSYLIRFPDKKKYSWEDLKKIRQKIKDLSIKI